MESNSQQENQNNYKKKYLLVKIPANVKNSKKSIELLGGKNEIILKVIFF